LISSISSNSDILSATLPNFSIFHVETHILSNISIGILSPSCCQALNADIQSSEKSFNPDFMCAICLSIFAICFLLNCHANADFCFSVASNNDSTVVLIFLQSKDSATLDTASLSFILINHLSHTFTANAQVHQAVTAIAVALSGFSLL
jgi:hypothetical protein